MGLSYTGKSCLLMASVAGCKRVPEPPARMMPLRFLVVNFSEYLLNYVLQAFLPWWQAQREGVAEAACVQP